MIGIYKITNSIDGKCYIGQSKDIEKRFGRHKTNLKRNCHRNEYLQRAYNKYGLECFNFEVVEECNIESLDDREKYYIEKYDSLAQNNGYNLLYGGPTNRGQNILVREKMRRIMTGRKFSKEHLYNLRMANRHKTGKFKHREISKVKMSCSKKGKKLGEKNPNAIISDILAKEIIMFLYNGNSDIDAQYKFNVSYDVIKNLRYNRSYKHILPDIREHVKSMKDDAFNTKIDKAISLYLDGKSQNYIAKTINISRNTLRRELVNRGIDTNKNNQYANTEVIK